MVPSTGTAAAPECGVSGTSGRMPASRPGPALQPAAGGRDSGRHSRAATPAPCFTHSPPRPAPPAPGAALHGSPPPAVNPSAPRTGLLRRHRRLPTREEVSLLPRPPGSDVQVCVGSRRSQGPGSGAGAAIGGRVARGGREFVVGGRLGGQGPSFGFQSRFLEWRLNRSLNLSLIPGLGL